jgi:sec-independent protein translocase protein TatC
MFEFGAAASSGDGEKEPMTTMGFLDHLEELRKRIVYSIAAVAVGFFVCWWKVERIYDVMQRPIMDALKANGL